MFIYKIYISFVMNGDGKGLDDIEDLGALGGKIRPERKPYSNSVSEEQPKDGNGGIDLTDEFMLDDESKPGEYLDNFAHNPIVPEEQLEEGNVGIDLTLDQIPGVDDGQLTNTGSDSTSDKSHLIPDLGTRKQVTEKPGMGYKGVDGNASGLDPSLEQITEKVKVTLVETPVKEPPKTDDLTVIVKESQAEISKEITSKLDYKSHIDEILKKEENLMLRRVYDRFQNNLRDITDLNEKVDFLKIAAEKSNDLGRAFYTQAGLIALQAGTDIELAKEYFEKALNFEEVKFDNLELLNPKIGLVVSNLILKDDREALRILSKGKRNDIILDALFCYVRMRDNSFDDPLSDDGPVTLARSNLVGLFSKAYEIGEMDRQSYSGRELAMMGQFVTLIKYAAEKESLNVDGILNLTSTMIKKDEDVKSGKTTHFYQQGREQATAILETNPLTYKTLKHLL